MAQGWFWHRKSALSSPSAQDEIIATAVERLHEPQQIISDLHTAETSEAQVESVKYQMTIAKLLPAKELAQFDIEAGDVNEVLIRNLVAEDFLDHQRNVVLIVSTDPA